MLRIRLQRTGNRNNPTFRLVVTDRRNAAKGKSKELLGHYLPTRDPAVFEFNKERVEHWIGHGAAPTDTVARLLAKSGMKGLEKFMERYSKQKKKKAVEEEPAPPPPPPAADAPAEQQKPAEEVQEEQKEEAPAEQPKEEEKPEEAPAEESKEEEAASEEEGDKKEGDA